MEILVLNTNSVDTDQTLLSALFANYPLGGVPITLLGVNFARDINAFMT